ncbi:MAG TPA: elongation factor G [Thermomicrobiaceae bacterium]|nr:elongation factor G [Thermomicrobiaceae bacterium]
MKSYAAGEIRNVGLFSHGSAGKTSLTEAILYVTKAINRVGRIEEGTTASDWDPDEVKRQISISTSLAPVEWRDHKINILDAPGYADFLGEMKSAMRACDSALILMDASAGVEVGTEQAWKAADEVGRPRAIFINKLDRENASFEKSLASAQEAFGKAVVPLVIPIGAEKDFRGVIDLIARKAYLFGDGKDGSASEAEIPPELQGQVEEYRTQLVEQVCEGDDDLMMRYLEGEDVSDEELDEGLRKSLLAGQAVPVYAGAATACKAVTLLLDAFVDVFPAPQPVTAQNASGQTVTLQPDPGAPLAALVFKTMADPYVGKLSYFRVYSGALKSDTHVLDVQKGHDERVGQLYVVRGKEQLPVGELGAGDIGAVAKLQDVATGDTLSDPQRPVTLDGITFPQPAFSAAVHPKTKSDLDKMGSSIQRLIEEDPSLHVGRDGDTGETLVSGLGESHVQIALERMARKFGVNVETGLPTVAYRETISMPVKGVEYKHKKQTGGHGQYGHVYLDIEPLEEAGFEFRESVFGGSVPRNFFPAVEKGVREAMEEGVLAGFPVVNVKVTLTDGSYHTVDSSEMAFKLAASQAFKKGALQAKPVILEPVMKVKITVPESFVGDVMSDLNTKRGHVQNMAPSDNGTTVEALVPAAECQRYATDLRSITQGRGSFSAEFDHYQAVPAHLTDQIIAERKAKAEAHA